MSVVVIFVKLSSSHLGKFTSCKNDPLLLKDDNFLNRLDTVYDGTKQEKRYSLSLNIYVMGKLVNTNSGT